MATHTYTVHWGPWEPVDPEYSTYWVNPDTRTVHFWHHGDWKPSTNSFENMEERVTKGSANGLIWKVLYQDHNPRLLRETYGDF